MTWIHFWVVCPTQPKIAACPCPWYPSRPYPLVARVSLVTYLRLYLSTMFTPSTSMCAHFQARCDTFRTLSTNKHLTTVTPVLPLLLLHPMLPLLLLPHLLLYACVRLLQAAYLRRWCTACFQRDMRQCKRAPLHGMGKCLCRTWQYRHTSPLHL